jgi:hypothetical protein
MFWWIERYPTTTHPNQEFCEFSGPRLLEHFGSRTAALLQHWKHWKSPMESDGPVWTAELESETKWHGSTKAQTWSFLVSNNPFWGLPLDDHLESPKIHPNPIYCKRIVFRCFHDVSMIFPGQIGDWGLLHETNSSSFSGQSLHWHGKTHLFFLWLNR